MTLMLKLIKAGVEDEKIILEDEKKSKKKKYFSIGGIIFYIVLICLVCFSVYVNLSIENKDCKIPTPRVVVSGSMAQKLETNTYLFTNNLNDQFGVFDLIITHQMPDEYDINLYDIIVYKNDDIFVIHRVVKIEEPNSKHPNNRLFYLQGDAVKTKDKSPVTYDQMYGIYRGQRIPKIGSFVIFLQSPMGMIVVIFAIFSIAITPILEKKLDCAYADRLKVLNMVTEEPAKAKKSQNKAMKNSDNTSMQTTNEKQNKQAPRLGEANNKSVKTSVKQTGKTLTE